MSTGKQKHLSKRSKLLMLAAAGSLLALGGCNLALVEKPYYSVTEVESFKTAGAPSRVMLIQIVDSNDTFTNAFWRTTLSNHGYPPRLRYVTDPADVKDGETIKPENRLVVVVNPGQSTMRETICTAPKSLPMDETNDRITVRFGFCVGDKIISETRGHFNRAQFAKQIEKNADTINYQLFPRHLRNDNDRRCNRFVPGC